MLPGVGYQEVVVLLIIAVLLFGSRLPEVLQNVGKSYAKLRKGLTDIQNTFQQPIEDQDDYFDPADDEEDQPYQSPFTPEVTAPKFTLPEPEQDQSQIHDSEDSGTDQSALDQSSKDNSADDSKSGS